MSLSLKKYADRGQKGLVNIDGASCYMNSAIQCLSACTELTDYIVSGRWKQDATKEAVERKSWMVFQRYADVINGLYDNDKLPLRPRKLKDELAVFSAIFRGAIQQDCHECILLLLELMHDALQFKVDAQIHTHLESDNTDDFYQRRFKMEKRAVEDWIAYFKESYSPIVEMFYGQYCSIHSCNACNESSFVYDPFVYLTLPIPESCPRPGKNITIYDCFAQFIKPDELQGENQYICESAVCKKQPRVGTKTMKIWKSPNILIVCLKRFVKTQVGRGISICKNNTLVEIPATVDIVPYLSEYRVPQSEWNRMRNSKNNRYKYDLFAVSNHSGNVAGGHYTAATLNQNGKWYFFDDSRVTEVPFERVITPQAYVLFYRRHYTETN